MAYLPHEHVVEEARDRPSYAALERSKLRFAASGPMRPLAPDPLSFSSHPYPVPPPLHPLRPRRLHRFRWPIVAGSVHVITRTIYSPPLFAFFLTLSAFRPPGSSSLSNVLVHAPHDDHLSWYHRFRRQKRCFYPADQGLGYISIFFRGTHNGREGMVIRRDDTDGFLHYLTIL